MSYVSYVGGVLYPRTGPITNRSGEKLAFYHGFMTIQDLAKSMPDESDVIDVGAGFSMLGHSVTTLRPDINWTNFDAAYAESQWNDHVRRNLAKLKENAPSNLRYVTGSILAPPQEIREKRFARVFSYYMLPHIINNGQEYGLDAAKNLLTLGSSGDIVSIGPISHFSGETHRITIPDNQETIDALAKQIVDSWMSR